MSNCNGLPLGKVGSKVISEMLPTDGTPVNAVADTNWRRVSLGTAY